MSKVFKNILKTISLYFILLSVVWIANFLVPSGPCTPGGVLLIFLIPFISIGMVLYNLSLISSGDKSNIYSLSIHLLIILIGFCMFFI